jgi:hypothetical protein
MVDGQAVAAVEVGSEGALQLARLEHVLVVGDVVDPRTVRQPSNERMVCAAWD